MPSFSLGIASSAYAHPVLRILSGSTDLFSDETWEYVRFKTSGTFEILNRPLEVSLFYAGGGGGGAGGGDSGYIWLTPLGNRITIAGAGGAAGAQAVEINNVSLLNKESWQFAPTPNPANYTVTVGAGGSGRTTRNGLSGSPTTFVAPNITGLSFSQANPGGGANGADVESGSDRGGSNGEYSGSLTTKIQRNNGVGGFPPYQPFYYNGGGGAGAGGNGGTSANLGTGGVGVNIPWDLSTVNGGGSYGAGGGGSNGGYQGVPYDYWNFFWPGQNGATQFGSNGFDSQFVGANIVGATGGNGTANRGTAGGTGGTGGGNGGSGVFWIRYRKRDVGR